VSLVAIGVIGIVVMLLLLFSRMPVGFAMMLVGFAGFGYIVSPSAAAALLPLDLYALFSTYSLLCIPLFILMGEFAFCSGIGNRLYDVAHKWVGQFRGGVAMATVWASAAFGAVCGNPIATAATIGTVALPQMKKLNYDEALSTSCVAAGGTLAELIPPGITLIVYGIMTKISIGKLFAAGVFVGILDAVLFCFTIYALTRIHPSWGPAGPRTEFREKLVSIPQIWETVVVFAFIMGGIYAGWFSPMQAGGIGAAAILIIALSRRIINRKHFTAAVLAATRLSCMVMILLAGATVFGHFLAVTRIPFEVAVWIESQGWSPFIVLIMILAVYFVAGFFIDALAFMMLTLPIFFPLVVGMGIDPIWFGVVLLLCMNMGALTPPVGILVYVVKGIAPDVPLETIFKGIFPFLIPISILIGILWAFPEIVLFLPGFIG